MSQKISLKETERKVFTSTVQDGLWDILIGCFLLEFTIAPLLSHRLGDFWSVAIFLPFWGLVYFAILLVRKFIVKPRLGEVTFGKMRRKRLAQFSIIMVVVNLIAFILGVIVFLNFTKIPRIAPSILFAFIILVIFSLMAFILNFNRSYLYGLLAGFSPLVGEWLFYKYGASHHGLPITFGITAVIIILTGVIVFVRFLIDNPMINILVNQNDQPVA